MILYKNLRIFPTFHDSLDFSSEIRNYFYQHPPDLIAVEFPENLKFLILQGIDRLPKISVVLYYDEYLDTQLYIPITPADSLVEALRLGEEYAIPVEFIDIFIKNYQPAIVPLPDPYVLHYIPYSKFYDLLCENLQLKEKAQIFLRKYQHSQNHQENPDHSNNPIHQSNHKEPSSFEIPGEEDEKWLHSAEELDSLRNFYMASRLAELMKLNPNSTILVVVGMNHWENIRVLLEHQITDSEITAFEPEIEAQLMNVRNSDIPKLFSNIPNILFQFEIHRQQQKSEWDDLNNFSKIRQNHLIRKLLNKFDILEGIQDILSRSLDRYANEYKERISFQKLKILTQYARNLAIIDNQIIPDLFNTVLAAKSIINDDFAWIVYEECIDYPFSEDFSDLPSLHFSESGIVLNGKRFSIRRNIPVRLKSIKLPLQPKLKENYQGEWKKEWMKGRYQLVSHIPEDIFEEQYFQHIRNRSLSLLRDKYVKIHKFSSTLMDGIDFRKTIRNWPFKHEIYVREEVPIQGSVDSVVVIFDYDNETYKKYPYRMMWYAEHDHESDLGFYSTYPGVNLVGPGISRIELGGVVSFYPPRGVPNIWSRRFQKQYPFVHSTDELLLLSALLFAQKKFITYVAPSKPRQFFYQMAEKLNLSIIFLPLNRFNPVSLRALRHLHILAGKNKRNLAYKYINKRKY